MGTKLKPDQFDCYAKLLPDEPYMTLMGRDEFAPALIRRWASLAEDEIANGDRPPYDIAQVQNARKIADEMEAWRRENDGAWRNPSARLQS